MSGSGQQTRRRVLIVDDHPIVRLGLARMIESAPDLAVCGDAENVTGAKRAVRELQPDVVVVDLTLGQGDGLELVRDLRAHHPSLPILVLSMHEESIYAERMLAAGARGYIMKEAASDQLLIALRRVLAGKLYLSDALSARLQARGTMPPADHAEDPLARLSNREMQVLAKLGRGLSSRDIAADLTLSVKTVESHRQSIKRKLNLATNSQLLQYALTFAAETRGGQ
ncbi:MAG: response regulator transcription factor [Steroidobacteraceae bacterium]|nr:response regulator transcription factor [Steroidobacteraceae bacterium]MCW5572231.1 response regulator transcription factor [Steroidobacteraceae bacterium]